MKKIGEVTSYLFGNNIILGLDQRWLNAFEGLPKFSVLLDNENRLVLKSQKVRKSGGPVCE